jgi:serine/threonine protein kinase
VTSRRRSSAKALAATSETGPPSTAKVKHISRRTGAWAFDAGTLVTGRYELVVQLAQGGMSLLWAATDRELRRDVVVKFLRLDANEGMRARFEAEARVAASLRSQHIIEVFDLGVAEDVPYMVLERLVGDDLGSRLGREQRLTLAETASIARQAARGLQVAHRASVVHRDIKASNLFLTREPAPDEPLLKILDFGVAKVANATGRTLTSPGMRVGSPLSMSPEQVNGASVDFRTDLFSLATVLYRCVTGQRAFWGEDFATVLAAITKGAFAAPSVIDPELPRALDAFFARGLAVDPDERFGSALELARAFERAVSPEADVTTATPGS